MPTDEVAKARGRAASMTEPIYGTTYWKVPVPPVASEAYGASGTVFPARNPFIPDRDPKPRYPKKPTPTAADFGPPSLLTSESSRGPWRLWHRADALFGLPRAAALVMLRTSRGGASAADAVHGRVDT